MFPVIRNALGERLDYTFHSGATDDAPVVVIGHGVTGHKDRPFLIALADGLSHAGFAALRVSYSGNANSEGAFAASNISKEVDDLGAVLDVLGDRTIVYAGHSMGGAVGVQRTARDPRIRGLISLAAIVHTRAFAERTFGHLAPGSGLMFDKPGCVLAQAYMDDLRAINSVIANAERITVPWLFVHGTADVLVPIENSRDAFARTRAPKEFIALDGADHVFEPGQTPRMVEAVTTWCRARFG